PRRSGRSPRVRRNRGEYVGYGQGDGSISARAEEPSFGAIRSARFTVDLRACGGTSKGQSRDGEPEGRSPRVRRNLAGVGGGRDGAGSISARAEEPRTAVSLVSRHGVDLRACGGTNLGHLMQGKAKGRSPRVRRN